MRRKAAEAVGSIEESPGTVDAEEASPSRSSQSWAMLIKRVYEVDPVRGTEKRSQNNGAGQRLAACKGLRW